MARIKQVIGANTGAGSVAGQYKKSAATSASVFNSNWKEVQRQYRNSKRRKSNGGNGG